MILGRLQHACMRPRNLSEYIGQAHLLSKDRPFVNARARAISRHDFLGALGSGKTTLAKVMKVNNERLLVDTVDALFEKTINHLHLDVKRKLRIE